VVAAAVAIESGMHGKITDICGRASHDDGQTRPSGKQRRRWPWLAAPLALLLTGCVSVSSFEGLPLSGDDIYLAGIPPVRQDERYACGEACLAAVAAYWEVPLAAFREKFSSLPREASGPGLQAQAEALGLQAVVYRGSVDDLRDNLQKGRPLIVMIPKPVSPAMPPGGLLGRLARSISEHAPHPPHWVIVLGVRRDGAVILHDPASGPLTIQQPKFVADWAAEGNACVLVTAR
jgi:predicted double-glycine peptidase